MEGGFRNKNMRTEDKYKNLIYKNKEISRKDYNEFYLLWYIIKISKNVSEKTENMVKDLEYFSLE